MMSPLGGGRLRIDDEFQGLGPPLHEDHTLATVGVVQGSKMVLEPGNPPKSSEVADHPTLNHPQDFTPSSPHRSACSSSTIRRNPMTGSLSSLSTRGQPSASVWTNSSFQWNSGVSQLAHTGCSYPLLSECRPQHTVTLTHYPHTLLPTSPNICTILACTILHR